MMCYTSSSDDEPEIETLNISNDQYYYPVPQPCRQPSSESTAKIPRPKNIPKYGSIKIRHSLPAYDLWKPFYPTYLSEAKFRNFHRPKLRHFNNGPQATKGPMRPEYPVKSLSRHIFKAHMALKRKVISAIDSKLSREEIIESFLVLRSARELSAKTGELYLFEYCEEFPPVLSQIGMVSNITTYRNISQKRISCKTQFNQANPNSCRGSHISREVSQQNASEGSCRKNLQHAQFGFHEEIKSEKQSKQIYFHQLKPNSSLQVIENNLYRAPIYAHNISPNDFIVIRTRNSFYIRPADGIFVVGQTMPLTIIPSPTETQIQKFRCDLSNVHIHKLFRESQTVPPSLELSRLLKLFPDYHRSVLLKRLRSSGAESGVIKQEPVLFRGTSNYGAISLVDLRSMMKPEMYCVNMSMLAARQRLRELNYTESMIHPTRGHSYELEPEVLAAPWNTSKVVISALRNQVYIDFKAYLIDPTGSREGFSCVAWPKSPIEEQQLRELRNNTGNYEKNAEMPPLKNPLRDKIVHEKLSRLATYMREAQNIFEIQANSLTLQDSVTSDEEDNDDIDEDNENISDAAFNQQLEDLNQLVTGNRSVVELNYEKEEEVRRQMLSDFKVDELNNRKAISASNPTTKSQEDLTASTLKNKILMITRTYDYGGRKIERTEIVREPRIIALYVKQKGGSVKPTVKENGYDDERQFNDGNDLQNNSIVSTKSETGISKDRIRPRSASLGPSELCRADGTILRISKKVLDECRPFRQCRK